MTGGGPDRKTRFCTGAKICSGKAANEQEAARLCAEAAANPKAPRAKRGKSKIDVAALSSCIIRSLDGQEINQATLPSIISSCTGVKAGPSTREKFIKKCFKENTVTGDIKEASKLRPFCAARWKEQEAGV